MVFTVTKIDNNLEEQSFLQFWYPRGNREFTKLTMPFFENIYVEEAGDANYTEYNPQSRPGSLFSYSGSRSRAFNLTFSLTYPHLYSYAIKDKFTVTPTVKTQEEQRRLFFQIPQNIGENPEYMMKKGNAFDFFRDYGDTDNKVELEIIKFLNSSQEFGSALADPNITQQTIDQIEAKFLQDSAGSKVTRDIIDIILYWVNIIRSSILNNTERPSLGPPIVRLNHGILYQDIPCVCTNYRIAGEGKTAGYDQRTMLDRSLTVNMTLREHRVGDFTNYDIFDQVKRDNLAGWEAVLDGPHSIDPIHPRFTFDGKLPKTGPTTTNDEFF